MKLKLFAGAVALTALFAAPNFAPPVQAAELALTESAQPRINISRIKSVLKLTAEQQAYWPPVEAALRDLARRQAAEANGLVSRVSSFVTDSRTIAKIGAAARPLVRVLDDRQKADAIMLVREMGLGHVLAAMI
jgi:hypothetical protein